MLSAAAAEALGHIGDEDAVGPLVDALARPGNLRRRRRRGADAHPAPLRDVHVRWRRDQGAGTPQAFAGRYATHPRVARACLERIISSAHQRRSDGFAIRRFRRPSSGCSAPKRPATMSSKHSSASDRPRYRCSSNSLAPPIATRDAPRSWRSDESATVARSSPLSACSTNATSDLSVAVASALARLGDPRAFEPLLALLGDKDVAVRQAVVGALNSIGHPDMASRICTIAGRAGSLVRESAVKIAGYFGYATCVDCVVARCADADEAVRAAAIEHLPYFDDGRALQIFASVLDKDTPRVRAAAAKALGSVPGAPALLLLRKATARCRCVGPVFRGEQHGPPGRRERARHLRRARHDRSGAHVRIAAIEAIGRIGGDSAAGDSVAAYRDETEVGLAAIAHPAASAPSTPCRRCAKLLRSRDAARRSAAVDAIAACSGAEAIELLQWTASADEDGNVVRAALEWPRHDREPQHGGERSCGRRAGRTPRPIPRGAPMRSRSPAASRPPRFLSSPNRSPPTIRRFGAASSRRSDGCRIPSHRRICSGRCRTPTMPCAARRCEPCPGWERAA